MVEIIDPLTDTVSEKSVDVQTKTSSVDTAGQTAGILVEEDDSDMSALPIGVTLVGFGAGAAHIGPQEYEKEKTDAKPLQGENTYQKMNVFKK